MLTLSVSARTDDSFAERINVRGIEMELKNTNKLRVGIFFKVYRAALYTEVGAPARAAMDGVPMRLELVYYRSISTDQFIEAAMDKLEDFIAQETLQGYSSQLEALHSRYIDVEAGDRYSLTYLPGTGLILALNGNEVLTVEDEAFARDYLRIWLGDESVSRTLRDELMGEGED